MYKILQVDHSAEPEVVKSAYKRLASKYHPDIHKSPDAESRMMEINRAYKVIGNLETRKQYDIYRTSKLNNQETINTNYREEEIKKKQEAVALEEQIRKQRENNDRVKREAKEKLDEGLRIKLEEEQKKKAQEIADYEKRQKEIREKITKGKGEISDLENKQNEMREKHQKEDKNRMIKVGVTFGSLLIFLIALVALGGGIVLMTPLQKRLDKISPNWTLLNQ